jgi:hypothetical protein
MVLKATFNNILVIIDNEEFTVKTNLMFDAIYTDGLLKSSEWKDREKKMGINVRKYLINLYA